MRKKVKRILDLVRAGKLTLDDAKSLLAALHSKLVLQSSDRELLDSLLAREDLETAQIAEHLLLLRGLKDLVPEPPRPPRPESWHERYWGAQPNNTASFSTATTNQQVGSGAQRGLEGNRRSGGIEGMVERITDTVERAVETAMTSLDRSVSGAADFSGKTNAANRILKIAVESSHGDEYSANIPVSLAPHLHKLIPPHGIAALEAAGFSIETLQLLIESDPPSGQLIAAEDSHGNEVNISIK